MNICEFHKLALMATTFRFRSWPHVEPAAGKVPLSEFQHISDVVEEIVPRSC